VRYSERKEFLFDSEVFKRSDTQTALQIQAEYVRAASPNPYPKFFEVDRSSGKVDDLWHMPLTERTTFARTLDVPAIAGFQKPDWRLTKLGIKPIQQFTFWLANLHLHPFDEAANQEEATTGKKPLRLDYFPLRGDLIYYIGYRLMIINVVLDPKAYWAQTNVWLGLICEACIVPDGDARPIPNQGEAAPAELSTAPVPQDWPGFPPNGPTNIPHNWP
jgi:hypothetical protein